MNFYCEIEDYFYVSKNVFYLKLEVDFVVLRVRFKIEKLNVDEKNFFKIVYVCFLIC